MTTKILPAPVGGWNARDPLHATAENEAIELINLVPRTANVVNRGGSTTFYTTSPSGYIGCIRTLPGATPTGEGYIIAILTEGASKKIVRIALSTATATDITGTITAGEFSNTYYTWTIFRNRLFLFLADYYSLDVGLTGNANKTGWTGIATTYLTQGNPYKGRMYMVKGGTSEIWYGGIDQITGALTLFDLTSILHFGGSVAAVGSTSRYGAETTQDMFVIVSTTGELLIYQGDYPGADTWSIIFRGKIAPPLGKQIFCYLNDGTCIITTKGLASIPALLSGATRPEDIYITDKITSAFITASAEVYSGYSNWECIDVPEMEMLIVTGPYKSGYAGARCQFVQNTTTKAWCKFTQVGSMNFATIKGRIFWIADINPSEGKIYEMKAPGTDGNVDYNIAPDSAVLPFQMSCRQAFNFLGDPTVDKSILGGKIYFDLVQNAGHSQVTREVQAGVDTDFGDADDVDDVILGDITADGTTHYAQPVDLRGEGNAVSLIFKAKFGGGYQLAWNFSALEYEESTE